jgi:hypothetical protein
MIEFLLIFHSTSSCFWTLYLNWWIRGKEPVMWPLRSPISLLPNSKARSPEGRLFEEGQQAELGLHVIEVAVTTNNTSLEFISLPPNLGPTGFSCALKRRDSAFSKFYNRALSGTCQLCHIGVLNLINTTNSQHNNCFINTEILLW